MTDNFPNTRIWLRVACYSIIGLITLTSYQNCSQNVTAAEATEHLSSEMLKPTVTDTKLDPLSFSDDNKIYVLEQYYSENLSTYMNRPLITFKLQSTRPITKQNSKTRSEPSELASDQHPFQFQIQSGCEQMLEGTGTMERQRKLPLLIGTIKLQTESTRIPDGKQNPDQCPDEMFENEFQLLTWVDMHDFIDNVKSYEIKGSQMTLHSSLGRTASFLAIKKFKSKEEPEIFRKFISLNTGTWSVKEFLGNPCHDGGPKDCKGDYQQININPKLKISVKMTGDITVDGICEKLDGHLRSSSDKLSELLVEARLLDMSVLPNEVECTMNEIRDNEYVFHILKYIRTLHRQNDRLIITTQGGNSLVLSQSSLD